RRNYTTTPVLTGLGKKLSEGGVAAAHRWLPQKRSVRICAGSSGDRLPLVFQVGSRFAPTNVAHRFAMPFEDIEHLLGGDHVIVRDVGRQQDLDQFVDDLVELNLSGAALPTIV